MFYFFWFYLRGDFFRELVDINFFFLGFEYWDYG